MFLSPILPLATIRNATRKILNKVTTWLARAADVARPITWSAWSADVARPITWSARPTDVAWTVTRLTRTTNIAGAISRLTWTSHIWSSARLSWATNIGPSCAWARRKCGCDIACAWTPASTRQSAGTIL
jgi:hypothetical protein